MYIDNYISFLALTTQCIVFIRDVAGDLFYFPF